MINDNKIEVIATLRKGAKNWLVKLRWKENGKWKDTIRSTGRPMTDSKNGYKLKEAVKKIKDEKEKELMELNDKTESASFVEYVDQWLMIKKHTVRQSTYTSYSISANYLKEYFGDMELQNITAKDIQRFYQSLLDKGFTANTVKHYNCYLSSIFTLALKHEVISKNPLNGVELPKVEIYKARAFSVEQLKNILEAVENTPIETAVCLGAYCGLRRSEVCGLEWSDVDFNNNILHIRKTRMRIKDEIFEEKTKSQSSTRDIPFNDKLKEVLLKEKQRQLEYADFFKSDYIVNDFVCRWENGKPLACGYISKHFSLVLKKLGYIGFSFHSLRHTTGTLMCNSGRVSVKTASAFLGHSDLTTTNRYLHPDLQAKSSAAAVLSDILG